MSTVSKIKPKRAGRVIRGLPQWLYPLVVRAYGLSNRDADGRKMHPSVFRDLIDSFLIKSFDVHPSCIFGFLDHAGRDDAGNLISEAYIRQCLGCQKDAVTFAAKLGLRYELSELTYHAPKEPDLMRLTFFRPGLSQ